MAYDAATAERVRRALSRHRDVVERPMMGRLCFMVDGAMCCCVHDDGLMVRVTAEEREKVLAEKHTSPAMMRGEAMDTFVQVAAAGISRAASLDRWIARGLRASQRAKQQKSKSKSKSNPGQPPRSRGPSLPEPLKPMAAGLRDQAYTVEQGWGAENVVLKVDGKIFAMCVGGELVLKLPRARVDALVEALAGRRFAPRADGREMKEWIVLPPRRASAALAREAYAFVAGAPRARR